ncbi:hypothetical protein OM076_27250 [Solirubrobacter ginsenosidimutans]|uniref:Uncharacterized protein n=1 Tax=Solirubrobacter ginsenosidimutans TaxID=490573 RepID=A0A9X3MWI3_9ACTN|nr:hypothetical protein [Solirubrobacter ginsenosidimutans]MDA0163999.1 hypothetical protein [Solirubrobacter ginsenosidimutans]
MLKVTAAAALSTLLIAAAPAEAKTFRGKTNQGRTASLVTGADGVPTRVRVSWRAPCKRAGYRATGGTKFAAPFTAVSADLVQDTGKSYRVTIKGGLRGRISTDLVVKRDGERWVGTLGVRELFARHGKVVDVCQVKKVRFVLG